MIKEVYLSPCAQKQSAVKAAGEKAIGCGHERDVRADGILHKAMRNLRDKAAWAGASRQCLPYLMSVVVVAACTAIGMAMTPSLDEENFAMLYLLGVVFIAARYGRLPSIISCLLSVASYHILVVSPRMIVMKYDNTSLFTFLVMLIVALMMSHFTARIRAQALELDRRVRERTKELAIANESLRCEIEQRLAAEEDLRKVVEELARSNTALQHFARVASHDLQEPLRSMRGFTHLLARRYKGRLDDKADQFIGHIEDCARRMERLIDGILSHARVQSSEQQFEAVDLNEIVKEAMQNLEAAIKDSGAGFISDALPVVKGDELQLIQLFQNLFGNAIKFRSDRKPKIEIECRAIEAKNGGEGTWWIAIRDNGIGFDTRYKDQIFTMFKRLHGNGSYPGSGIGLAICRSIVERHGGKISVDSVVGEGSTFHILLPFAGQEAERTRKAG